MGLSDLICAFHMQTYVLRQTTLQFQYTEEEVYMLHVKINIFHKKNKKKTLNALLYIL